jgi:hypothetical protein
MPGIAPNYATTGEAADGQPRPTRWMIDAAKVADLEKADRRCDHHRGQRWFRQISQQARCQHQQQRNCRCADDAGQLCPGARGLGHRSACRAAADGKSLKESGHKIGGPEAHHLLIGVDMSAGSRGVGARENAGVGE